MADDLQVVDSKPVPGTGTPPAAPASADAPAETVSTLKQPEWTKRIARVNPEDHPVFGPVIGALQKGLEAYHKLPGVHAAESGETAADYAKHPDEERPGWMGGLTDENKWYNKPFARFREGLDRMGQDLHDFAETHRESLTPAAYVMLHGAAAASQLVPVGRSAAETGAAFVGPPELRGEGRVFLDVADVHKAAEAAGVEYRGLQAGVPGKVDDLLIFQDPQSKTSVGVKRSEFTPEKLHEHVLAARDRMLGAAGKGVPTTLAYQRPPEDLETRAKRLYGAELDHDALANGERAMGFYLKDGSFVGHPAVNRKPDLQDLTHHRLAAEIMGEPNADALPVSAQASHMRRFMDEAGAVRMHNAEDEANVQVGNTRPTPEQLQSIAKLAQASAGQVVWDLGHDKPTSGAGSMGDFMRAVDKRYGPATLTYAETPKGQLVEMRATGKRPGELTDVGRVTAIKPSRLEGYSHYTTVDADGQTGTIRLPTGKFNVGDLIRGEKVPLREGIEQMLAKDPERQTPRPFLIPDREKLFEAIDRKAPGDRTRAGQIADEHMDRLTHPENYNAAEVEQSRNAVKMWLGPERRMAPRKPTTLTYALKGAPTEGFYSPARRAAEMKLQDNMTGEQALATLRNTPGVKGAELQFSGLEDFLKGKAKVTKQEVLDHLAANEVKVNEARLGELPKGWTIEHGPTSPVRDLAKVDSALDNPDILTDLTENSARYTSPFKLIEFPNDAESMAKIKQMRRIANGHGLKITLHSRGGERTTYGQQAPMRDSPRFAAYLRSGTGMRGDMTFARVQKTLEEIKALNLELNAPGVDRGGQGYIVRDEAGNVVRRVKNSLQDPETILAQEGKKATRPMYQNYTLPGPKKNYRELLFTQPGKAEFKSAHFGEHGRNLLAHARVTDRVIDGKKTLFVEEIQSDWARALREEGPRRPRNLEVMTVAEARKLNTQQYATSGDSTRGYGKLAKPDDYVVFDRDRNLIEEFPRQGTTYGNTYYPMAGTKAEAEAHLEVLKGQRSQVGVAPQPFRDWHELVMKRLLRMAGEEGYDQLAWTTGRQQAERYHLGQVADRIYWGTSTHELLVERGGHIIKREYIEPKELPEWIGKEAADQLLASEPMKVVPGHPDYNKVGFTNKYQAIDTKYLQVGGRWASNLYDKMTPAFVDKFGKQWGLKTLEGTISSKQMAERGELGYIQGGPNQYSKEEPVHVVPLTPEFKAALPTTKFPLFHKSAESVLPDHPPEKARQILTHEWGHVTVAAAHGYKTDDIIGPGHEALPPDASAGARINMPELLQTPFGPWWEGSPEGLAKILEIVAGGAAAEELHHNTPWRENTGFTGDGTLMYELLRDAGFEDDEAEGVIDQYVQRAKGILNHEKIRGMAPAAAAELEEGNAPGVIASPARVQRHYDEVRRRLYGEGHDEGGAPRGAEPGKEDDAGGEGKAAGADQGAAALTYSETKKGKLNTAPYAKRGGGVGGNDAHLVDQLVDEGAKEAPVRHTSNGNAYGVILPKDITLYHSTTSTAAKDIAKNGLKPLSGDLGKADLSTNLGTRPLAEGFAAPDKGEHEVLLKVHLSAGTKIYRDDYPNDPMHVRIFHTVPPQDLEIVKGGRKDIKLRQNVADNETMADPDTRYGAARHEAGHAVVSELLMPGSVNGLSLDEKGGLTQVKDPASAPGGLTHDQVKSLIAMSYAGGLEEPGGTTAKHVSSDVKVRERILGPQGLDANEDMAAARARVNALLADPKNRDKIDQVAQALNQKGKLTGEELRKLIGGK